MAIQAVYDRLFRFRLVYIVTTLSVLATLFIFDSDLKQSIINLKFFYFIPYFAILALCYFFFFTAGIEPGYVGLNLIQNKPKDIEMEVSRSIIRSDLSLEVFKKEKPDNLTSLFNPTDPTSINDVFSNDSDNSEEEERAIDEMRPKLSMVERGSFLSCAEDNSDPLLPDHHFCNICQIYQPYRTKHCHYCEKCISKYDHHCGWIGNCVGELNHRKFWTFLFFQNVLEIWTIIIIIDGLASLIALKDYSSYNAEDRTTKDYMRARQDMLFEMIRYIVGMVLALVVLLLAFLFTGLLFVVHSYLILTNQTTWEVRRLERISYLSAYPKGFHPFSKGPWENIKMVFFHHNQIKIWELPFTHPHKNKIT